MVGVTTEPPNLDGLRRLAGLADRHTSSDPVRVRRTSGRAHTFMLLAYIAISGLVG
jgi:hypothetical protein